MSGDQEDRREPQTRGGRTSVNELIAVTTVSMPEYALSPMVATSAVTEASAITVPNPGKTRLPASWSATRPSEAPSRVASHAPQGDEPDRRGR